MNDHDRQVRRRRLTAALGLERRDAWRDRGLARKRLGARHRLWLALDPLEDRCLLSGSFTVNSTADSAPVSEPTPGTLRWAVEQADASGGGATINFNLSTPATITLTQGPLDVSNQSQSIAIDGPGAGLLTISGGGNSQVFTLESVPQGGQTVSISDLTISGGVTTGNGGGVFNRGAMTLIGVSITGNFASANGGGVYNRGVLTLENCTLNGNTADSEGGGLDNVGAATLINCNISSNVTGTTGTTGGGGFYNQSNATLALTGCTISGNKVQSGPGGGLLDNGFVNLANCTISGNIAGTRGGGLDVTGTGTANLIDCTLSGNDAAYGGALENFLHATANLTDCTITDNSAPKYGGGLNSLGPVNLTGCTITGNSTSGGGGGAAVGPGAVRLTNCTITGNSASYGGGLVNYAAANVTACTISGNTAATGAGITNQKNFSYSGKATLTDTIVAGNATSGGVASDIGGSDPADVTGTANLIGTGGSGGITGGVGGNLVGVANPGLGALANNGGLTQTMALQPGSPALGAGIAVAGLTTDQRGLPRPGSGAIDIGAFEHQAVPDEPPIASYQAVNTNEDIAFNGQVSASDADNNPLTYSVVAAPSNGALTLQSNGSFIYTPAGNWSGTDSFTFQAFDGIAYSNVATVSIVVDALNPQPGVANNDSYSTGENTAISIGAPGVLANDTDPNNLPLTAFLISGPSHGALMFNSNGSFTYTPATNYYGTDSFTYEATDGQIISTPATVSLVVIPSPVAVNDAYTVPPGPSFIVGEGATFATMTSQPGDSIGQGQTYNFGGSITASVLSGAATNTVEIDISAPGQSWTLDFAAPNQGQLVPGTYTGATRWPVQGTAAPGLDVSGDGRKPNTVTGQFTVTQAVYGASGNIVSFVASFKQYTNGSGAALSGQVDFDDTLNQPNGLLANDIDLVPGTTLVAALVNGPSHGTLAFNSDGSFSYMPAAGFVGVDSFTYQDTAGTLVSNVATVTLTVGPPVANNDRYSTAENTAISIGAPGVLGNDTDPNNKALTAVLIAGPAHGSLTLNSDGSFSYSPAANYYGIDTFTYEASNGLLDSNGATVTITVGTPPVAVNDAYAVVPDVSLMAGEGPSFVTMTSQPGDFIGLGQTYNFSANITARPISNGVAGSGVEIDISPPGQLPWTLDFAAPSGQLVPGTYTGATRWPFEAAGVPGLDVSGDGRGSNTITGQFIVTQAVFGASGNVISFAASFVQYGDGSTGALIGQVEFNDTLNQPNGVLANDTDPISGTTLTAALVSGPSHGTVAFNSDGSFSYIPASGFVGIDSFTYQDAVGTLVSNVATVTLTVDQPPVANDDSYSASENTTLAVSAPGVLANDIDLTSKTLSAALVASPVHGSLTLSANGSFTYTPAANFFGTDSFTYNDSDGIVTSGTATVTITVAKSGQASFIKTDTTTQGNWIGKYGTAGYDVINSSQSLPSDVTVTPAGYSSHTWPTATAPQALQVPPTGSSRIASCWYSATSFTVDVDITDALSYNLELYVLDYDNRSRSEKIQFSDAATGTVLSTQNVSSFAGGAYLNWTISGNVLITITKTGGVNGILNGLFFDPSSTSTPTSTGLNSSLNASTYGQSVTFTATVSDTSGLVPAGSVEFYDGTTDLGPGSALTGSGNSATSTFTTSALSAGTHSSITAIYTPAGRFVGSSGSFSQSVNPRALTITVTAMNKVYDGTTTATVTLADNRVAGDTLTDTDTNAVFLSKNAATGQIVNVTGISISGPGASNYTFNSTATTTANITPAPLTLAAVTNTKVYDGTTSAAAIPTVSGLKGTDSVTNLTETYATATVGTGKSLNVSTFTVNDGNSGHNYTVTLVPNTTGVITAASSAATAVFVAKDITTQGNWIGKYGTAGYDVINSSQSLPSDVTVTPAGYSSHTWPTATAPQALQVPPTGSSRIASCWYSATSFTVDVDITDALSYNLELYVLDYDNRSRSEKIQFSDAATGTVLSTQNVSSFAGGAYLNWTVSGNVLITITKTGGVNGILNGLFFDAAPAPAIANVVLGSVSSAAAGAVIGAASQMGTDQIGALDVPSSALFAAPAITLAANDATVADDGTGFTSGPDVAAIGAAKSSATSKTSLLPAAGAVKPSDKLVHDAALAHMDRIDFQSSNFSDELLTIFLDY